MPRLDWEDGPPGRGWPRQESNLVVGVSHNLMTFPGGTLDAGWRSQGHRGARGYGKRVEYSGGGETGQC
jgi:hypothetical protein